MKELKQLNLKGERALFGSHDLKVTDCIFEDGESPLKESSNIELCGSMFRWKYPLWFCRDIKVLDCTWFDMARAGVWYTDRIRVERAVIQAPKNFRRCKELSLTDVTFTDAKETLWNCNGVKLRNVTAKGDYFAMGCSDMEIDGLILDGNYSFDGVKNAVIRNSRLLSKDAFWNSENVTVYDSFIPGEYLGWNAKNLTLVNCTVESLQGMCYIDNLVMKNCKLINTTLAFEYAKVEAEITSEIDSILNPQEGSIRAPRIGELIIEKDRIDPEKTKIVCTDIVKHSAHPEWIEVADDV
ncbi:MAG: DUF3737 family protein [Lachnospiraceae bacterium]|nr:DUF3737 family protein [Lachnospiraceae bacterium]